MEELADDPRFVMLIGLMERLTGREVKLVPPATMMLGARKGGQASSATRPDGPRAEVHLTSVSPVDDGRSFRVDALYELPNGVSTSTQIDVEREVIQRHAVTVGSQSAPLEVEIDPSAVSARPDFALQVHLRGSDGVSVNVDVPHLDLEA